MTSSGESYGPSKAQIDTQTQVDELMARSSAELKELAVRAIVSEDTSPDRYRHGRNSSGYERATALAALGQLVQMREMGVSMGAIEAVTLPAQPLLPPVQE